jgi:ATP-binding cassette, subfamily G (WHITE), member 2, PDR
MVEVSSTSVKPSPTPTVMEVQPSVSPELSVREAKESFADLERQLSRASTLHRSSAPSDPEKGEHDEDVFNLREYLTSANAAQDEAGITNHHKRVGVTWHDLEVIVPGGGDFKVIPNLPPRV